MKIKSEKQQIRERVNLLEQLISWQQISTKRARRRYGIKCDWVFSFWILNDSSTLKFCVEREEGIEQSLKDYNEILGDKLINCR
tara:strand:+ start:400 stop:651 length:252 start_codon:yes stop_codon:yes gene_type:complete